MYGSVRGVPGNWHPYRDSVAKNTVIWYLEIRRKPDCRAKQKGESAMPRGPRLDAPGTLHHVIIRGIERGNIVRDDMDRKTFVNKKKVRPYKQYKMNGFVLL